MTTTRHKITVTRSGSYNGMDWDADYVLTFSYTPGEPAQLIAVEPAIGIVTDSLVQGDLNEWARDWLNWNFDRAIDKALAERTTMGEGT